MKANGYYNHLRFPLEAECGLIEEDSIAFTSDSGKTTETPSFPLEIFPKAIRDIIEALEEYENYNIDFTSASFLMVFASAMGTIFPQCQFRLIRLQTRARSRQPLPLR